MYNEGWALVHMLQLSPGYVSKYSEFVRTVQSGVDSVTALEKVYGKTVSAIEKDLQEYIVSFQFYGRLFPVKLASVKESFPATSAPMFDVKLALTDLTNRPGKEAETRKTLEDLAREDPKRPEPWASLGYLEWRGNHFPEAVDAFGKAYELGNRSTDFLWDYGRLAERDRRDDAVNVLTELFKLEPDRLDVRMELAALQLNARRPGGALSVLADVHSVTPEDAPRFFTLLANAQIQLRDLDGARVNVAKLAANAKTPEDRTRVEQMQRYLEQSNAPAPLIAINTPEGAPRLTRPATPTQSSALPPPPPEIEGSFVEFICLEKSFKVIIDTAQGKKGFLIPDPNQVVVVGRAGGKVDLNCGPQTPVQVRIEYGPSTAGSDADGILKVLFFDRN